MFGPGQDPTTEYAEADITLAQRVLGHGVTVPLREGIAKTVNWCRGVAAA